MVLAAMQVSTRWAFHMAEPRLAVSTGPRDECGGWRLLRQRGGASDPLPRSGSWPELFKWAILDSGYGRSCLEPSLEAQELVRPWTTACSSKGFSYEWTPNQLEVRGRRLDRQPDDPLRFGRFGNSLPSPQGEMHGRLEPLWNAFRELKNFISPHFLNTYARNNSMVHITW